jgi:putative protease
MTPAGNFHFDLERMHNSQDEAVEVAPGDGHTVYVPVPAEMDVRFGLLMRDL